MEPERPITIVSGLPRSGTSLMMQMLEAGGIPPFSDQLRLADESNPHGYYEHEGVKRLKADASWLSEPAGKAIKIIHLLLPDLPLSAGHRYRVVFMRRALPEVIASQRAMLARQGKSSAALDDAKLAALFESQLNRVDQWLAANAIETINVPHHELLNDPVTQIERLREFFGEGVNPSAMAAAIDPSLWRQRA